MVSRRFVTGALMLGGGSVVVGGPAALLWWPKDSKPSPDQMVARRIVASVLNHQGKDGGLLSSDPAYNLSLSALLLKVSVGLGLDPSVLKGGERSLSDYFEDHPSSGVPSREVQDSILRYEVAQALGKETTPYLVQLLAMIEAKLNAETRNPVRRSDEDSLAWRYYALRVMRDAKISSQVGLYQRLEAGVIQLFNQDTGEWREFLQGGDPRGVNDLAVIAYEAEVERAQTSQSIQDSNNSLGFWVGEKVSLGTMAEYSRVFPHDRVRRDQMKELYLSGPAQNRSNSSQILLTHLQVAQALSF